MGQGARLYQKQGDCRCTQMCCMTAHLICSSAHHQCLFCQEHKPTAVHLLSDTNDRVCDTGVKRQVRVCVCVVGEGGGGEQGPTMNRATLGTSG